MTDEAPTTDFGDLQEVAGKYKQLKSTLLEQDAVQAAEVPRTTNAPAALPKAAAEAVKAPQKLSRRQRAAARRLKEALEAEKAEREAKAAQEKETAPMDVEAFKDLERFKFRVWIAKLTMASMAVLISGVVLLYMYAALTTKSVPDMALFGTIFGHLKEVLVVIIEAQK